jgi:hypothetical protein
MIMVKFVQYFFRQCAIGVLEVDRITVVVDQQRQFFVRMLRDEQMQGRVYLVDSAYTLERLYFVNTGKLFQVPEHIGLFEKVLAKNTNQFDNGYKWAQYREGKQAFRAIAAPAVRFASRVAAFKHRVIFYLFGKNPRDLKLVQRPHEAEIIEIGRNILLYVLPES